MNDLPFDAVKPAWDSEAWAPHPPPEEYIRGENDNLIRCPKCHVLSEEDDFDCLGADRDCVFCPNCSFEIQLGE